MTLFLATATVAFDQRDKTIFGVMTKPISRIDYLAGKWIGIMGLNAMLLLISAGSIFWFVQYLRELPALDRYDRLAVTEQVLTARVGVRPKMEFDFEAMQQRALETIRVSPELERTQETVQQLGQQYLDEERTRRLTVPPGEARAYTFENIRPVSREVIETVAPGERIELASPVKTPLDVTIMDETRERIFVRNVNYIIRNVGSNRPAVVEFLPEANQERANYQIKPGQRVRIRYYPANALTLRFKLHAGNDDPAQQFRITFIIGGTDFYEVRQVALVQTQTMLIPAGAVGDDGTLTVQVVNGDIETGAAPRQAINFPPDGLELMYKVSDFESNYLRGVLINWLKLGFLAMLGISAATFASFPVACLLAFCVFFGAQAGPFLQESIEFYRVEDVATQRVIWWKWVISHIATAVHFVLQAFGEIRPTDRLIDGRHIAWADVGRTFATITLAWTGLSAVLGWYIFRQRQLAMYSGHS